MTQEHPITPPPELVQQWINEEQGVFAEHIAIQAARWGYEQRAADMETELQKARDEELEACCEWLTFYSSVAEASDLRSMRRPKPPSIKEQALEALEKWAEDEYGPGAVFHKGLEVGLIRRALDALPD